MLAANIREAILMKRLMDNTFLALGEAYMKDELEMEGSLYRALDRFLRRTDRFPVNRLYLRKFPYPSNFRKNQRMKVSSHYNIDNDFYRLWPDEAMNYSYRYFKSEKDALYEAQMNKTDYILKKLALKEGMSLLNAGCDWGFLLIRATKEYGAKGTGTTLSTEQYDGFKEHIEEEGLERLLNIQLVDYRDLPRGGMRFDRVVSMGMVGHVSRENYDGFMDCMDKMLNPGGIFFPHFISSQKGHAGDPWIKEYIFPGGVIPSLRGIISLIVEHDFHVLGVGNLRNHYNKTLLCWEKNFEKYEEKMKDTFDEEFVRMWGLHLCSYTAAFHSGVTGLHQIPVGKGVNNELPMMRWY